MYEEGCRILSDMERRRGEELEEEEEEEEEEEGREEYMSELYLLKVEGEWKRLKENEVSVLRREKEEAERRREDAERNQVEERRRREEVETRLVEETRRREEAERRREEEKRELEVRIRQLEQRLDVWKPYSSLDGTSVILSDCVIKREGNRITHTGTSYTIRHCMIGGEMRSVCVC